MNEIENYDMQARTFLLIELEKANDLEIYCFPFCMIFHSCNFDSICIIYYIKILNVICLFSLNWLEILSKVKFLKMLWKVKLSEMWVFSNILLDVL